MKFLVDAQLPPALALWLRESGHDAQSVREVGLQAAGDRDIWNYALATDAAIITKDEDFTQQAEKSNTGPIIIWLRIGNVSNRALQKWFLPQLPQLLEWIEQGARILEIR